MPSRNFCDLCDNVIEDNYFSIEITHRNGSERGWEQPTRIASKGPHKGTVPVAANDAMVCQKCVVTILEVRDSLVKKSE
jgi:hypothetical protein